jgi:hypothetical protein
MDGIILQQVSQGLGIRDVVDRYDFQGRVPECRAEEVATDSTEAIDAHPCRHTSTSFR